MTTLYKYLIKPDIVQAGDEFKIISNQDVWAPSFRVGQEVIDGRYRRPIPIETEQTHRSLTKKDILQEGDEFKSHLRGWVPSRNVGGTPMGDLSYRRPIPVETKRGDCGSITEEQREIIDSERDKRNSAVIENEALKTRLENALSDKVVAQTKNDELYRKLVERDNYIINLTARLMDKEAVARRLTDRVITVTNDIASHEEFLRHVAQALGMCVHRISFQDVLEGVKSLTSRNKSHLDRLNDAKMRKLLVEVELENLKTALKKLC